MDYLATAIARVDGIQHLAGAIATPVVNEENFESSVSDAVKNRQ